MAAAALQQPIADSDGTGDDNYDEGVCAACGDDESREGRADAAHGWTLDDGEGPAQAGEGDVYDGGRGGVEKHRGLS